MEASRKSPHDLKMGTWRIWFSISSTGKKVRQCRPFKKQPQCKHRLKHGTLHSQPSICRHAQDDVVWLAPFLTNNVSYFSRLKNISIYVIVCWAPRPKSQSPRKLFFLKWRVYAECHPKKTFEHFNITMAFSCEVQTALAMCIAYSGNKIVDAWCVSDLRAKGSGFVWFCLGGLVVAALRILEPRRC